MFFFFGFESWEPQAPGLEDKDVLDGERLDCNIYIIIIIPPIGLGCVVWAEGGKGKERKGKFTTLATGVECFFSEVLVD